MSTLNLSGFPGSADVKTQLELAFNAGRLPHALILEGSAGSGSQILADILAKASVCLHDGEKPCGLCPGCVKAQAGSHPDLFMLDGDANPRAFPVDIIRQIRSDAYIKPNEAPSKVYVLRGAQNMSEISQNALLKVFEEPPQNVLFILTAVSAAALLPTVRSRAQIFKLEDGESTDDIDLPFMEKLTSAVTAANESDFLFLTADLVKNKEKLRGVLAQLVLIFRDATVLRAGGTSCLSGQKDAAAALGAGLTRDKLLLLLSEVQTAQRALDQNANTALLLTVLCANLRAAAGR